MPRKLEREPDKDTLYHLYCEQGLTQTEIGGQLGYSQTTVRRYLNLYAIATRPQGAKGAGNAKTKLTAEKVREIKLLLLRSAKLKALSSQFAVSISAIESIALNRTWTHIPWPYAEAAATRPA